VLETVGIKRTAKPIDPFDFTSNPSLDRLLKAPPAT